MLPRRQAERGFKKGAVYCNKRSTQHSRQGPVSVVPESRKFQFASVAKESKLSGFVLIDTVKPGTLSKEG